MSATDPTPAPAEPGEVAPHEAGAPGGASAAAAAAERAEQATAEMRAGERAGLPRPAAGGVTPAMALLAIAVVFAVGVVVGVALGRAL